jgi:hypothetical protein
MASDDDRQREARRLVVGLDEGSRLVGATLLLVVAFGVLAVLVSPWFYVGIPLTLGGGIALAVVARRSGRAGGTK